MLQCSLLQERYYSNSIPKYRDREAIRVSFWCVCSLKLALEFQERKAMDVFAFVFLSSSLFLFYFVFSDVANSITQSQSLSDSKGTNLVSKNGGFVLGFFNTGNSNNRYLGIWYNNIPVRTVVWVANWRNPITDSSGVLKLNSSGSLLLSQNKTIAWLANSIKEAGSPVVELLDSGNLVLREENKENPESYLWQSFDYPSDTWLPGMKLGWVFVRIQTFLEKTTC